MTGYHIREDLREAHARAWDRLARPGAFLKASEKRAVAEEARAARVCPACAERKAALSPEAPTASPHTFASDLPEAIADVVHRIVSDADQLTSTWFARVVPDVMSVERYVEMVGVIAETTAVDRFDACIGAAPRTLPDAIEGPITAVRSKSARLSGAWVPTVAPEDLGDDDPPASHAMYRGRSAANIHRALSLVPESMLGFFDLDDAMYLPDALLRDFAQEPRAITHAQIELLAARVSALNRCLY